MVELGHPGRVRSHLDPARGLVTDGAETGDQGRDRASLALHPHVAGDRPAGRRIRLADPVGHVGDREGLDLVHIDPRVVQGPRDVHAVADGDGLGVRVGVQDAAGGEIRRDGLGGDEIHDLVFQLREQDGAGPERLGHQAQRRKRQQSSDAHVRVS